MSSTSAIIRSDCLEASEASKVLLADDCALFLEKASLVLTECFTKGNKVLICGNGGSMCDAEHFAEEMTGYFSSRKRPALPVISLNSPSHMSCVANDVGFDSIFARSIEALGAPYDVLIVLSTSGNSNNIIEAVKAAKVKKMATVAFLGKDGGRLKNRCDVEFIALEDTARIQEIHMTLLHILVHVQEERLQTSAKELELVKLSIP